MTEVDIFLLFFCATRRVRDKVVTQAFGDSENIIKIINLWQPLPMSK